MNQRQPDGRVDYYRSRQMVWFVNDEICVDGMTWAACYQLPSDREAIIKHVHGLLGKVHIIFNSRERENNRKDRQK